MRIISTFILLLVGFFVKGQTLRINEFSQGSAVGGSEWVELIVVSNGTPIGSNNCGVVTLDITGWVLDDNNGSFSPTGHYPNSGIASGHIRFKNGAPWNALPVGAVIVIYDWSSKDPRIPADDLTDTNKDCVYIIPSNSSNLEYCPTYPAVVDCNNINDYNLATSACYVNASATTWTNMTLANSGDAVQLRTPGPAYNLVHGVVYGNATTGSASCNFSAAMVGNSLAPYLGAVGSGQSAYFNGTAGADFYDATKWVVQSANLATPGAFNSANDSTFITDSIRGGCTCQKILDLYLLNFFASRQNDKVKLEWQFNPGRMAEQVEVERSSDAVSFTGIGRTTNASFLFDQSPLRKNYYRLKLRLPDGNIHYSRIIPVMFDGRQNDVFAMMPNPFKDQIVLQKNDARAYDITLQISDITGRKLYQQTIRMGSRDQLKIIPASFLPKGMLIANIFYQNGVAGDLNSTQIKLLHQ